MKEFVIRKKEVYIVDVIIEADNEFEAIRKVINGDGNYGDNLERSGYLNPRTWEVLEL